MATTKVTDVPKQYVQVPTNEMPYSNPIPVSYFWKGKDDKLTIAEQVNSKGDKTKMKHEQHNDQNDQVANESLEVESVNLTSPQSADDEAREKKLEEMYEKVCEGYAEVTANIEALNAANAKASKVNHLFSFKAGFTYGTGLAAAGILAVGIVKLAEFGINSLLKKE